MAAAVAVPAAIAAGITAIAAAVSGRGLARLLGLGALSLLRLRPLRLFGLTPALLGLRALRLLGLAPALFGLTLGLFRLTTSLLGLPLGLLLLEALRLLGPRVGLGETALLGGGAPGVL